MRVRVRIWTGVRVRKMAWKLVLSGSLRGGGARDGVCRSRQKSEMGAACHNPGLGKFFFA